MSGIRAFTGSMSSVTNLSVFFDKTAPMVVYSTPNFTESLVTDGSGIIGLLFSESLDSGRTVTCDTGGVTEVTITSVTLSGPDVQIGYNNSTIGIVGTVNITCTILKDASGNLAPEPFVYEY